VASAFAISATVRCFILLVGLVNKAYSINRRAVDGVKNAVRMYCLQCACQNLDVQ
jgi:hypothetical protein